MPFRSKAQMKYLYANHPEVAKEFAAHTSKAQMARLPEHRKPSKPAKKKGGK